MAALCHRKAAEGHDRLYGEATLDGDEDGARQHYDAAQAHRAAASYHDDQDQDEDDEPENEEDETMTGNAYVYFNDPDALDIPALNFGEPSYDRTQGGAASVQYGRGGLEPQDPDLSSFHSPVLSPSEFMRREGVGPDVDTEADVDDENWENKERLGLHNPPCAGSPSPIDPMYEARGAIPGHFDTPQGYGRAGNYDLNSQASSDHLYYAADRSAHGITEADGLPLPQTMAAVCNYRRAEREGRREVVRNVERPHPMTLDYLPLTSEY
jgi:hypothetical protein